MIAQERRLTPDVANYLHKVNPKEINPKTKKPRPKPWLTNPIPLFQVKERFGREPAEPGSLGAIAREVAEITGSWNPVELLTPTNVETEKEKFFTAFDQGEVYNPQFTYNVPPTYTSEISKYRLISLHQQARGMKIDHEDRLGRIARIALDYKIRDDRATMAIAEALHSRAKASEKDQAVKAALEQKYPGTDDVLWEVAQVDFAQRTQPKDEADQASGILTQEEREYLENREFNAQDFKEATEWVLAQYGMLKTPSQPDKTGFRVVIAPVTAIDVRDKSVNGPTVFIPDDKVMDGIKLLELLAHEIEGHARQSANGQELFIIGGGPHKIDDEMLYEGEGKHNDNLMRSILIGEGTGTALPVHTYAVRAAEEGKSFYEIFQQQLEMYLQMELHIPHAADIPSYAEIDPKKVTKGRKLAWQRTIRTLRGHTDTTNKEGFANAKNLAYMRGDLIVQQLRERNLGYLNEAGIIASRGLQLLAEFDISEKDLPLKHQRIALRYWDEVLKKRMIAEQNSASYY